MIHKEFFRFNFTVISDINWREMSKIYIRYKFLTNFEEYLDFSLLSRNTSIKLEYIMQNLSRFCIITLLCYHSLSDENRTLMIEELRRRNSSSSSRGTY